MKYAIREKIFSLADRFAIADEDDNPRYEVVGKILSFGNKLDLYNISGDHELYIEQKIFKLLPEYTIYRGSETVAKIFKRFTIFKPKYSIESIYGDFTIEGDVFAHEFNILKEGNIVAWISKRWISLSDTYMIDIVPEEDQLSF